jgi:hypothetical protein
MTTGILTLVVGMLVFLVWARWTTTWPFGPPAADPVAPSTVR